MKAEGIVVHGGSSFGGDRPPGKIRFQIGERRPTPPSPTALRELPPELAEDVERRKKRAVRPQRVRTAEERRASSPQRTPDIVIQRIVDMAKTGIPVSEIARQTGVSYTTTLRYVTDAGIPRRPRRIDLPVNDVVAAYETGLSMREVAEKFDVSKPTIERILRKAGVSRRSKGAWRKKAVGAEGEDG